ncbi:MAG TPA: trimeric intracellular cation channel family protein [Chitinophagaceae bacterium]|nr:trimeric intracellular cation channel family protein [Chitinophagaceae bacterium]
MIKYDILNLIDILGTIAFTVAGVSAAMQKRLDIFGILVIAFITALGGGTLRDVIIGDLPVVWIRDIRYPLIITAGTVAAIVFHRFLRNWRNTLLVFDALGLGLFTIVGLQKGIEHGFHPATNIALGTITGCFGGVIRDVILRNIPLIFQKEIYATACIVGGCSYFLLQLTSVNQGFIEMISISIIVVIRLLSVWLGWRLPEIYRKRKL